VGNQDDAGCGIYTRPVSSRAKSNFPFSGCIHDSPRNRRRVRLQRARAIHTVGHDPILHTHQRASNHHCHGLLQPHLHRNSRLRFQFTMPAFFVLFVRFGIIKTSYVTARRRYIYAASYIICAIVTPDGGPLADTALFVPIAVLLEVAVFLGRRSEKRHVAQPLLATTEKEVHGKCRWCGNLVTKADVFCPTCGKSRI